MQHEIATRRRRWPLLLIVLALVVAGAWAAGWYYAAGFAESRIAGWREREAKAGRIHTCGSQTVSGFPLQFEMRCADPGLELKSAQPPLSIKAKDLLILAQVWQPTVLTGLVTGPLTVAEPGQPATLVANWRNGRSEVRGLPTSPEQVTIALDAPAVERVSGSEKQQLFSANRAEIGGRLLEGTVRANPVIEVTLKLAGGVAPTLHPVTGNMLDADITAVLRGLKDFSPKPWRDRFREIQAADGRIEISNARFKQGETIALAKGALSLSASGRPHGVLELTVANLADLLPVLGLDGRSPQPVNKSLDNAASRLDRIAPGLGGIARQNAAPALIAGLNFIGKPAEIEGKRAITLPLRFNDGAVTLGPIPLGQAAPLF